MEILLFLLFAFVLMGVINIAIPLVRGYLKLRKVYKQTVGNTSNTYNQRDNNRNTHSHKHQAATQEKVFSKEEGEYVDFVEYRDEEPSH